MRADPKSELLRRYAQDPEDRLMLAKLLDKAEGFARAGSAYSPATGIEMTFSTTQPAVQLYSGNYVAGDAAPCGKGGVRYPKRGGFCLESQHYPCSPNFPDFPSTILRPGEEYREITEYRFEIRK